MSPQSSVLYDAPGPRTRRRTTIAAVLIGVALLAGAYYLVYRPLEAKGQFTAVKWGPLVDLADPNLPLVWERIRLGIIATLTAAALAIVCSLLAGTLLAVVRMLLKEQAKRRYAGLPAAAAYALRGLNTALRGITRFCVEVFRGLPVLVTIFFAWRISGISDPLWPLVIGLSIYNSVVIAEIIRSGMEGLPRGQREAADSLGLTPFQAILLVQLPQAFRIMLPALISQLVVILKDTTLGYIITYEDILAVAQQMIQILQNPIQMYVIIGAVFIAINYALSQLAAYVQRRVSRVRAHKPAAAATELAASEPVVLDA
ncbi:amino acid ABC transporter permease [Catellatospora coxensis]|uniref:Glutamate ABC transporter permease n=1 Tax=Catellatospora coxensis TaxID=310354 RepID=A0A8J3L2U7_9ACTN|nr:amino acid ABC transporter permease [Catellatospora coxensis]GIG07566.1 glutamate ABC transporter permease [Catellatospora coxensis]